MTSPDDAFVAIGEVKWQLSASETRDVIARNEYLKKGADQLSRIREFLNENTRYLLDRKILSRPVEQDRTIYLLLCKGHMASEDVIRPGILVADWDVFSDYIARLTLAETANKLASYEYLPVEGRDFTIDVTRLQFGDWVLGWKQFHAPELPPDTETEALEELHRTAYKFFPRER